MKKVLIINYLFPPTGGGGVIRVAKFAKYLPQFGWEVFVITPKKTFYPIQDNSLLKEVPKTVKIRRIGYFEPGFWFSWRLWQSFLRYFLYRWLLVPDNQALWIIPAVIAGYKLIKREKIKVIYTSAAPYSDHLIGWMLKKITKVRWIADFRDEWTENPYIKYPTKLHRYLSRYLEKKVLHAADGVTTVSGPILEQLKGRTINQQLSVIPNGFDREDFSKVVYRKMAKMKILYAGSIYDNNSLHLFEAALRQLNLNIELEIVGFAKRVPHREAVRRMQEADVLLFVLDPIHRPGVITGKLFEYLASGRPILALAPEDTEAVKLIKKYRAGLISSPQNITEMKNKIRYYYQLWRENHLPAKNIDISEFDRKNLTEKLGELLANTKPIKLCLIGNLASPQNQILCANLLKRNYQIHFISTKEAVFPGIKTYFLGRSGNVISYFLRSTFKIRKLIKEIKPDIVHGQDLVFAGIWAYLSGFHPYVITPWGSDINNYEKFVALERNLLKRTLQATDLLTANSEVSIKKAVRLGAKKENCHINHFGVNLSKFKEVSTERLRKKLKIERARVLFCPRSIAPIYNTDILIEAFDKLAKNYDVRLIISRQNMDKLYFSKIESLIKSKGLRNKIILVDKIPNDEMPAYYSLADVVVSLASSEGCSSSFLEAMAIGCKIVNTDIPVMKEWLKGENIFLVPVRNTEKTFLAIKKALSYPQKAWQKYADQNRRQIHDKAEINQNIDQLDRLYRGLI